MVRPLSVALIGSRGIPASYGGFETLMEELACRLVDRGFRVTVYCRSHHSRPGLRSHRGADLVVLPTVRAKYLDTPVHTLLAALHAAGRGFDAALVVNSANAIFLPLLQSRGIPVALNVDGLERQRAKWGPLGRGVYWASERLAAVLPEILITDAAAIQRYYRDRYRAGSRFIAYGVDPEPVPAGPTLARLGLEPGRYFLFVGRFEPENNPHRVVEAYRSVPGETPLVMVGGAPYPSPALRGLEERGDPRVRFPGPIYGRDYRELLSNALAFVQAKEVGGTHPALVEAMGYGNCPLLHDTPTNREIAAEAALYFDIQSPGSLAEAMTRLLASPELAARLGRAAAERAAERYSWERITDQYAELFRELAARGGG